MSQDQYGGNSEEVNVKVYQYSQGVYKKHHDDTLFIQPNAKCGFVKLLYGEEYRVVSESFGRKNDLDTFEKTDIVVWDRK